MNFKVKRCKNCKFPTKVISHGDFDEDGDQLYWCKTHKSYVTDKHVTPNDNLKCKYVFKEATNEV